jgi:hypothetical protein
VIQSLARDFDGERSSDAAFVVGLGTQRGLFKTTSTTPIGVPISMQLWVRPRVGSMCHNFAAIAVPEETGAVTGRTSLPDLGPRH